MTEASISAALTIFETAFAGKSVAPFTALHQLADAVVGVKLFTVMETDMAAGVARRSFSSDPEAYAVSGSKPINRTEWFDRVHIERKPFVANTIADIAEVFPDHELIWSLGCGSVVNLPIAVDDAFKGTVNLLHEEHFYTPERVELIAMHLSGPAERAYTATHS